jgi:glycerol-3-phosphate dehydrogenase (NAD(P)+)
MAMTADGARLMPELADAMAPGRPSVLLSGPSFADEVMRGLPAAVVAAGTDSAAVEMVQQSFRASQLRVYASDDPLGVAIGGTMKNVIAIAAGCAIGLGLGDNARAAIITRGLAEMARLAAAEGAEAETIYGLSGAGDLALSCAGPHSRNMAYGLALGRGETPDARLAEGRNTVAALAARGRETGIELPITNGVDLVVNGGAPLGDVVASLLARPAGSE